MSFYRNLLFTKFLFSRSNQLILLILIGLHLIPVWVCHYFPTQDGPSHLYNAQIIREYWNSSYQFPEFYDIRWTLLPNWITHFLLASLLLIFPSILAEKVFLSLYVIFFPVAVIYFLNSIEAGRKTVCLMVFPFTYNYLFLMGFYSFALSVPFYFFALGYWWRHKDNLSAKTIILLNLILIGTYFSHLISYGFALISLVLLIILFYYKRILLLFTHLCCLIPASSLVLAYLPSSDLLSGETPKIGLSRLPVLLSKLLSMEILISWDASQSILAYLVSGTLVFLLAYSVWKKKDMQPDRNAKTFSHRTMFLVICLCLLLLYLVLPWSVGPGGWLNDRIAMLVCVLSLVLIKENSHRWWRFCVSGWLILISLINVLQLSYHCRILDKELRAFNAEIRTIEKNQVLLPLFFDGMGNGHRIGIFVNAGNYYCLDNGGINVANYETNYDYFPVKFKDHFHPPLPKKEWVVVLHWDPEEIDLCGYAQHVDYVLLWGKPDPVTAKHLEGCYRNISTASQLKLFKPKNLNQG
ncbi:hypothetical protein CMK22_05715 [Candidatus Poribacteria bacterium]|nr:hypothetical protein [Candidatus Poribacteria bacterium]